MAMATETTDRQAPGRGAGNRAPARGPRASTTALGALSVFMGAFAFLSFQMGSGKDPALGAGTPVAAAPAPVRRQVIVRKVVITKVRRVRVVVHERVPTPGVKDRSIPAVNHVALPAAAAPPKPVSHTATTTHTAPAPAPKPKPAPAAAPKPAAPAPAPAPPTTHQS
jgi:hypothetical protein